MGKTILKKINSQLKKWEEYEILLRQTGIDPDSVKEILEKEARRRFIRMVYGRDE